MISPLKENDDSDINIGVIPGVTGSMRISHCSPGLSPGEEIKNEQHVFLVYEINQKRQEMDNKIEEYCAQIQTQA